MNQPSTVHFAETEDPNELERIIAHAQLATISPLTNYQEFLRPTLAGLRDQYRCEFSPNVVCIHVTHPDLPSLSFYDLPGIIGQAESADSQFLVNFVRDLVTDYINDPEALILVTCSLENDIANSTAGGIARNLDATDRCIGMYRYPVPTNLLISVQVSSQNRIVYRLGPDMTNSRMFSIRSASH